MGRTASVKHEATTEYAREAVHALVSAPAVVASGLQANLTQRASTESWVGVLHSLTEHEHKVSISAYVALTEQHGGPSVHGAWNFYLQNPALSGARGDTPLESS